MFQYDPTEKTVIDPMVYGAYRRSKLPPPIKSKSGVMKSGRKNKEKQKSTTKDNNSFYNAIKNLGSGPVAKVLLKLDLLNNFIY